MSYDLKKSNELLDSLVKSRDYIESGNYNEAINICESILERYPKNEVALNDLCIAYIRKKEFDRVIEYFEKALMLEPNNNLYHKYYKKAVAYRLNEKASRLSKEFNQNFIGDIENYLENLICLEENEENLLVPRDTYLGAGVHIGSKSITPFTKKWIHRETKYGLYVLKLPETDSWIRIAANFIHFFDSTRIVVSSETKFCKKPILEFCKYTNAIPFESGFDLKFIKELDKQKFLKNHVLIICDPEIDNSILEFALKNKMIIISLISSQNDLSKVDLPIPCNNRGRRSLGLVFYLLTREIQRLKDKKFFEEDFKSFINESTITDENAKPPTYYIKPFNLSPEKTVLLFEKYSYSDLFYKNSIEHYKKELVEEPENHNLLTNLALTYSKTKQYQKSIKTYEKALSYKPNYLYALFGLGITNKLMKDYKTSLHYFEKLLFLSVQLPTMIKDRLDPILTNMGKEFIIDNEKVDMGIKSYQLILKMFPNEINALYNISYGYNELKNHKKALEYLIKAYNLDNKHINVIIGIGNQYRQLGNYKEAIRYHKKLLNISPDSMTTYKALGWEYTLEKKYLKAKECYEKCIELNPDDIWGWINIWKIYLKRGEVQKSLKFFNIFKSKFKEKEAWGALARICVILGNEFYKIGLLEYAEKFFILGIKYNTKNYTPKYIPSLRAKLGKINSKMENIEEALNNYEKALQLNKNSNNWGAVAIILKNIGNLYYKIENISKGKDYYTKAKNTFLKLATSINKTDEKKVLLMEIEALKCEEIMCERIGNFEELKQIDEIIYEKYKRIKEILENNLTDKIVNKEFYKNELDDIQKLLR